MTSTTGATCTAGGATTTAPTSHPAPLSHQAPAAPRRHWLRAGWVMTASGWSANQFSALLGAYRSDLGLATATTTALFAVYVLGLIPGLLLGGPLADRRGRRPVVFASLALSALATCLLMAGPAVTWLMWPGRFVTGIGAGALLSAGSAWIKELSSAPHDTVSAPGVAARRSGLFLSAGFATGGLAASLIAQWAPQPMITAYVPHLVLSAAAALSAARVPETLQRRQVPSRPTAPISTAHPKAFRRLVAPVAPWVFIAPSVALATLPGLVAVNLAGWQTVYAGVMTAVTPGAGILMAPLARRLAAKHRIATAVVGLAAACLGLVVAALSVACTQPVVGLVAAAVLGAGYGLCVAYGLTEVAVLAPPHRLARLTARFWALCYLGFLTPYAITLLSGAFAPATVLLGAAALAVLTLVTVLWQAARKTT